MTTLTTLNSRSNLPILPNTAKLKQNLTTTIVHERTLPSSAQTNMCALTNELKGSKTEEPFY